MRHQNHTARLGRPHGPRKALIRDLVEALLKHEKIETTNTRAMEVRRIAEKMVTLAKDGSMSARRSAFAFLRHKEIVHRLFTELGPRFADRKGGYLRVVKSSTRWGDGAPMAIVEFIDRKIEIIDAKEAEKRKSRSQRIREYRRSMARNLPRG